MVKYIADPEHEEYEDTIEEIEHAYSTAQRATKAAKKVIKLSPEELLAQKVKKRTDYLAGLEELDSTTNKEFKHLAEEWDMDAKTIKAKAAIIGLKAIQLEVDKIMNAAETKSVIKADGTIGKAHNKVLHDKSSYCLNADGTPDTFRVQHGDKIVAGVKLNTTKERTKGWTFEELANPNEYMNFESVCATTNDDGLKQFLVSPVVFGTNPEWKGDGFCCCEVKNKDLNMFLREWNADSGTWEKVDFEDAMPKLCCGGKVSANGKCLRHNKANLKEQPKKWTGLGDGWTMKKL